MSKGGRITIPRVAVEKNLPSVADKRHHEVVSQSRLVQLPAAKPAVAYTCLLWQVALDANDTEWTFVIKSWPNGGENKRVYVMEKTGAICCLHYVVFLFLNSLYLPCLRHMRGYSMDYACMLSLTCTL